MGVVLAIPIIITSIDCAWLTIITEISSIRASDQIITAVSGTLFAFITVDIGINTDLFRMTGILCADIEVIAVGRDR